MNEGEPEPGFRAQPRRQVVDNSDREKLLVELACLRSRFERAIRNGRDAFLAPDSGTFDIGALAIINLADFVTRDLPPDVLATLPVRAVEGLRATRNVAVHNYAALDNQRLWLTVSEHAGALIDTMEAAVRTR